MSRKITIKLGTVGKVKMCKRVLKEQTSENEKIPFYKISTFGGTADTFISKELFHEFVEKYSYPAKGDILISASGTIGKTVIFDGKPSYFQDSNIVWIDNNEKIISNSYLYYFYQTKPWQTTNGSTITRIYNDDLRNIEITFPESLNTQQKIASVLSALDDKIKLNNKINDNLEQMAKTLYDYWFVQFDFPDANGKPYKSSGGKMVWNDLLKREVPEGWEVKELRSYITSNRGVSYNGKDINSGGIPMINLNSFNVNGTFKHEGLKTFSGDYNTSKVLKAFDLVMCNTQQTALDPQKDIIGKSFIVPDIFDSEVVSSHHVTTIHVRDEALKFYINSLFNTEYFHRYISGYATGTNILGLNFEGVLSYQSELPSKEILKKYKGILLNVEKQKSRIIKENQQLSQLRDWLLPMLMNGQVKID